MAIQLQLRKGTKIQNDAFTGAEAELTYDTTTKGLRIHDGTTQGGHEIPVLVAVQRPTAENNYTWYRKWSDGWVEQGGACNTGANKKVLINLPVTMANNEYTIQVTISWSESATGQNEGAQNPTTTGFYVTSSYASVFGWWEVKGMAAN